MERRGKRAAQSCREVKAARQQTGRKVLGKGRRIIRPSIKGMATSVGLLWGGAILAIGLLHQLDASYGSLVLDNVASVYPGFPGGNTAQDALVGTG